MKISELINPMLQLLKWSYKTTKIIIINIINIINIIIITIFDNSQSWLDSAQQFLLIQSLVCLHSGGG